MIINIVVVKKTYKNIIYKNNIKININKTKKTVTFLSVNK